MLGLDRRVKQLNSPAINAANKARCVLYIMSRDQRVAENAALQAAHRHALQQQLPLVVAFNLYPKVANRNLWQYQFMIEGLKQIQQELDQLNIPLIIGAGKTQHFYKQLDTEHNPAAIYFDFSPLKGPRKVKQIFANQTSTPCFVVDAHNIVPVWEASDKEEFAAYTFRPKVYAKLQDYLNQSPYNWSALPKHSIEGASPADWHGIQAAIQAPALPEYKPEFKPGYAAAKQILSEFIQHKLEHYGSKRNDPTQDYQSNLSPYLHFGQISALEAVREVIDHTQSRTAQKLHLEPTRNKAGVATPEKSGIVMGALAFIEEVVVRKELSDNFCYYNPNYDNFAGLKPWAQKSLRDHTSDPREYLYTIKQLEQATTHDPAWNAAQTQLCTTGKMHGYMRMYWAKKILEWTSTPKQAIEYAIYLNDKYHLDGYDPNGYVGILWSIGGLHDRPWFERPIFGQIRYMNYNGLKKKFDIEQYANISSIARSRKLTHN